MSVVPGRILPSPGIKYHQAGGAPKVDDRASWNLRDVKFLRGATLSNWLVLLIKDEGDVGGRQANEFYGTNDPELTTTINGFSTLCRNSGINVGSQPRYVAASIPAKDRNDPVRAGAIRAIRAAITSVPKPDFVLVLLSNGDKHVYNGIKHLCDSYLDVATVCVQSSKIRSAKGARANISLPDDGADESFTGQLQYFANVALKVNMKLGGIKYGFLHAVAIFSTYYLCSHSLDARSTAWLDQQLTMLVGIDV
jgi:hypothetical protein